MKDHELKEKLLKEYTITNNDTPATEAVKTYKKKELLNELNIEVRRRFNEYYIKRFNPNLKRVAKEIGMSYYTLSRFKTGTRNVPTMLLRAIMKFINE